jgi:hypothetical protein
MNPAVAFMPKFFLISGAILVLAGVAQVLVRPRKPDETSATKLVNPATIKAVLFVTVGILGVLVGLGVIPLGPPR